MAGGDLNVSRRALLGAACAVPALSAVEGPLGAVAPLLPVGDPVASRRVARWQTALARLRRAEAALAAADGADEDAYDRLGTRHDATMCRLLRTPAPDVAALADKLALTVEHLVWEFTGGEACLAALQRDARRLAGRYG